MVALVSPTTRHFPTKDRKSVDRWAFKLESVKTKGLVVDVVARFPSLAVRSPLAHPEGLLEEQLAKLPDGSKMVELVQDSVMDQAEDKMVEDVILKVIVTSPTGVPA